MGFEHKQILPIPIAPETVEADKALIASKLETVRGIAVDEYDTNLIATATLFYDAVFDPENVVTRYGLNASEEFPDRLDVLRAPLQTHSKDNAPAKDEFIGDFIRAWTSEEVNRASLYPGAHEALRTMMSHGPTVLWSQGDMYGAISRYNGFEHAPGGSFEQMKKIAGAGIGEIRREIARASLTGTGVPDLHRTLQDVLTVVTGEDKFSDIALTKILAYLERTGSRGATIIDDRVGNIEKLAGLLHRRGFGTRGIWMRQGRHGRQDIPYDATLITEVSSIESITPTALTEGFATICDFDGVLSNQSVRKKLQGDAVYALLVSKGMAGSGDNTR